jgi:aminoglycoside 6'-N-acetyltransferase I
LAIATVARAGDHALGQARVPSRESIAGLTAELVQHACEDDHWFDHTGTCVDVRTYQSTDYEEWLRLRRALWPEIAGEDEADDAAAWLARTDAVVIVAARPGGAGLAGFVELGARPHADGCDTSPVAFLEGWYVDADVRRLGIGAALVRAGEAWARQQGYRELASDALLENLTSHRAHEALGFAEVERAVRYRKAL